MKTLLIVSFTIVRRQLSDHGAKTLHGISGADHQSRGLKKWRILNVTNQCADTLRAGRRLARECLWCEHTV